MSCLACDCGYMVQNRDPLPSLPLQVLQLLAPLPLLRSGRMV